METLMDGLRGLITSKLISEAADRFEENEAGIASAVEGLSATVLHGLAEKREDSAAFARLFDALSAGKTSGWLDDLFGLLGSGNQAEGDPKRVASEMVSQLFGDKVEGILWEVSRASGITRRSAKRLLDLVGPMAMGYVGKRIASDSLDAAELSRLLGNEKPGITPAVPMSVRGVLGISDQAGDSADGSAVTYYSTYETQRRSWLWPLLFVGVMIALFLLGLRACASLDEEKGLEYTIDLNGYTLRASDSGVEVQLLGFIRSGVAPCKEPKCWFTFDRLTFATGSAELNAAASARQLENIVQILKAYPDVTLQIGGHTDSSGSTDDNMELSRQRAEAVVVALALRGIAPDRLNAEGFGSAVAVASNDTEAGRSRNRRIDLRVGSR